MTLRLVLTKKFEKALFKLEPTLIEAVRKALKNFDADQDHPALNFEKIKGSDFCTIRATRGCRIVLKRTTRSTYEVIDVGPHDIYRRYG